MEIQKIGLKNDVIKTFEAILKTNKNNARLNYVFITDENVFVTCGRTAFIVMNEGLKAGAWSIVGKEKNKYISFLIVELAEGVQAPNISQVIPKDNTDKKTLHISNGIDISSAVIVLHQWTGSAFNYELLEHIAPLKHSWTISKQDQDKAIMLETDLIKYIISPYKLK